MPKKGLKERAKEEVGEFLKDVGKFLIGEYKHDLFVNLLFPALLGAAGIADKASKFLKGLGSSITSSFSSKEQPKVQEPSVEMFREGVKERVSSESQNALNQHSSQKPAVPSPASPAVDASVAASKAASQDVDRAPPSLH